LHYGAHVKVITWLNGPKVFKTDYCLRPFFLAFMFINVLSFDIS